MQIKHYWVFPVIRLLMLPKESSFAPINDGHFCVHNASLIRKACESRCTDKSLMTNCQTGCRTMFNALAVNLVPDTSNGPAAVYSCNQTCSKSYNNNSLSGDECKNGCGMAYQLYRKFYLYWKYCHNDTGDSKMTYQTSFWGKVLFGSSPTANCIDAGNYLEEVAVVDDGRTVYKTRMKEVLPDDCVNETMILSDDNADDSSTKISPDHLLNALLPFLALAVYITFTGLIVSVCKTCEKMTAKVLPADTDETSKSFMDEQPLIHKTNGDGVNNLEG